jgi:hypothetical protein
MKSLYLTIIFTVVSIFLFCSFNGCRKKPEKPVVTNEEPFLRDSLHYYNKDIPIGYFYDNKIDPAYIYYNNKRLEELYVKKGEYKKAYEYKTKTGVYNDSVISSTTQNAIAEIEMRYRQDTTLLKRDIIIAQREQKVSELQNMNIIIVAVSLAILLSMVAFLLYYRRQKDLQYARQVATITNLRMENVRNCISPHFMFNVVNAVLPYSTIAIRLKEQVTA